MPAITKLQVFLEKTNAPVYLEVRKSRIVVKDFVSAELREIWLADLMKNRARTPDMERMTELLEETDVRCGIPYEGAPPTLKKGGEISFYISQQSGQNPFWTDTIKGIITEVTL